MDYVARFEHSLQKLLNVPDKNTTTMIMAITMTIMTTIMTTTFVKRVGAAY